MSIDPAARAGYVDHPPRMGFFTDTSVCIGCKACEVACKEWNAVPEDGLSLSGMSYDNTVGLGASTWRHVAFIEQSIPRRETPSNPAPSEASSAASAGSAETPSNPAPSEASFAASAGSAETASSSAASEASFADRLAAEVPKGPPGQAILTAGRVAGGGSGGLVSTPQEIRWLMSSDVCKHCTEAGCLDVCPTGALMRTEFGTVVVQDDVCNGCGYCIPACPFGVIGRRESDGGAHKCTLCYDRISDGMMPACAKACPTESIQFGPVDELRQRAASRLSSLHEAGVADARLYLDDPADGIGGGGSLFLLLDEPEVYGLPPDPVVTTRDLPRMWRHVAAAAAALAVGALAAGLSGVRGRS
ncbi:MAG: 4Fe-4S dicluster domain-containing protein [Streptosporangiaceae bacterium]|nr:4Fe-4S dicluster domain-containing protein [Streptosporangiaceae bacterium]